MENDLNIEQMNSRAQRTANKKQRSYTRKSSIKYTDLMCEMINGFARSISEGKPQSDNQTGLKEDNEPEKIEKKFGPTQVPLIKKPFEKAKVKKKTFYEEIRSKKSLAYIKNRKSQKDSEILERKSEKKISPFIALSKKIQEHQTNYCKDKTDFYRNIKENIPQMPCQSDFNNIMKENQIKKFKETVTLSALEKKFPFYTFTYEGDILPVVPVPTKIEEKKYVDVEAYVQNQANKQLNQDILNISSNMDGQKVIFPTSRKVSLGEAQSEFMKNFMKPKLNKNVAVVFKQSRSPERIPKYFEDKKEDSAAICKKIKKQKRQSSEKIKLGMEKQNLRRILGIKSIMCEETEECEEKILPNRQSQNLANAKKKLKRISRCSFFERQKDTKVKMVSTASENFEPVRKKRIRIDSRY